MTVKIPLPDQAQLTPEIVATLDKLPPLNVFRMMANAPASFEPIINFAMSILLRSEFTSASARSRCCASHTSRDRTTNGRNTWWSRRASA